MSKKQSSVEWLFVELWNTPKDKFQWHSILRKAKAMHKEEMFEYIEQKYCIGQMSMEFHKLEFEPYYNETFGGQE